MVNVISINAGGSTQVTSIPNRVIEGFFFAPEEALTITSISGTTGQVVKELSQTRGGSAILTGVILVVFVACLFFLFKKGRFDKPRQQQLQMMPQEATLERREVDVLTTDEFGVPAPTQKEKNEVEKKHEGGVEFG